MIFSWNIFWVLVIYISGALSVLAAWFWLSVVETRPKRRTREPEIRVPHFLQRAIDEGQYKAETCVTLNLLLQFFFQVVLLTINYTTNEVAN